MFLVRARLRHDVDGCAARPSKFGRVVAPVNLEFQHGTLAQVRPHSAGIVIKLAAIHGHTIPSAIAAIEGKPALRRLLNSKVCITGQPRGVCDSRGQQGVGEIVAAVDGQFFDVLLVDGVGLVGQLGFHRRRLRRYPQSPQCRQIFSS